MNTPNPLIPQGTFLEQKGRSHIRIAVFTILAVHVVLLGSLLLAGCKRTTDQSNSDQTNDAVSAYPPPPTAAFPPADTSPPPAAATGDLVAANVNIPAVPGNTLPPDPTATARPPET